MENKEIEERLKYMLKRCDADGYCKYYTKQNGCDGCCDAVRIVLNKIENEGRKNGEKGTTRRPQREEKTKCI